MNEKNQSRASGVADAHVDAPAGGAEPLAPAALHLLHVCSGSPPYRLIVLRTWPITTITGSGEDAVMTKAWRTELEVQLDAGTRIGQWTEFELLKTFIREGGVPPLVGEDVWSKARCGDPAAIAEANRRNPGCVYLSDQILFNIFLKTAVAFHKGPTRSGVDTAARAKGRVHREVDGTVAASEAREWLEESLLPDRKHHSRLVLGPIHADAYPPLHAEVLLLREVYRHLRRAGCAAKDAMAGLVKLFPDFDNLDPAWKAAIAGGATAAVERHPMPAPSGGRAQSRHISGAAERCSVSDATEAILADVTGYSVRAVRKLCALDPKSPTAKRDKKDRKAADAKSRALAKDLAARIVASLSPSPR